MSAVDSDIMIAQIIGVEISCSWAPVILVFLKIQKYYLRVLKKCEKIKDVANGVFHKPAKNQLSMYRSTQK